MTNLDTLRHVTRLFPIFLGLRLLPVGAWFLLVSLGGMDWFPGWPHLALLAAVAAIWPIHRWYQERYGTVEPERLSFGRNWALLAGVVGGYLALGLGAASGMRPLMLALLLIVLATVALFALPRSFTGDRRTTAMFLAAAGLCGLLLLVPFRDPTRLGAVGRWFSLSIGLLLCLAGWIEHYSLARAVRRLGEGDGA